MVQVIRDEEWMTFYAETNTKDPKHIRIKESNDRWREQHRPEITRDSKWYELYSKSNKDYPEEKRIKEANVLWIIIQKHNENIKIRKARSMKVISEPPKIVHAASNFNKTKICQGTNMNSKPCQFKVVSECGRFCKKHNIV